ncbi:MAG: tripartite tricarboxylate transporter substrate binding protein [Reyranellaceae bacterium]
MIRCLSLVLLVLLGLASAAVGEDYPTRAIRLVVGYSPGGGNDLIARIVAARLQERLGQSVIVDNKPGAQSIVAAELVARAMPDGYTLLVAPSGPMTINPAVHARLSYSPERDFAPISLLAEFPLLLAVGSDQPLRSVRELVEYGRAHPRAANYGSSATPFQLAAELFNQRTGSAFQHVPYRGSGDVVQAVMAGQVLMAFVDSGPLAGPLKAGKVRALAMTGVQRSADFPDVPTFREQGLSDMEIALWTGLVAPAQTPAAIVDRLQQAIRLVLAEPETQAALRAIAVEPRGSTAEEYRALIARDIARWKAVATAANIKLE